VAVPPLTTLLEIIFVVDTELGTGRKTSIIIWNRYVPKRSRSSQIVSKKNSFMAVYGASKDEVYLKYFGYIA
jgi:hypothetical protein